MKNSTMKAASLIVVVAMVAMVFAGVQAAPVQPYTRFGDDATNRTTPVSSLVTTWIDGVEYGSTTSDASGYYVLETRGDDIGTTAVKEGGINTNPIQYVIGGRLTTASAGQFCGQTATYTAGAILEGPLTVGGTQPRLLKINNVSSQSTFAVTDWIVIWNPAGATVDITTYSLAVGTAAAQPIIAGDIVAGMYTWNAATVPASGFVAINMAKWGGLSNTGNSIKIIHTATAFIVDRVEYGTIATAPENTEMTNAAAPASAQEIHRTAAGTDTNSCSADFSASLAQWLPYIRTATVTALAPVTPSMDNTPAITYTYSAAPLVPTSVALYRGTSAAMAGVTLIGTDATVDGAYTVPAAIPDGTYYFAAVGNGETTPPTASEFGPYVIDTVGPTITTIVPADGATGVALNAQVVVTWSEAMNPAVGSVNINPARTGTWAWSAVNTVYTFTPAANWVSGTLYTLTFTLFTDVAGNAATGDLVKTFTTVGATATVTALTPVTPSNDNTPAITYTYTNTPTSVELYRGTSAAMAGITLIGTDATVDGAYTVPAAIADGTYYFAARGISGEAVPTASEFGPYVIDTAAPTQTHVPTTGATGVAINANVVVTYSEAMNPATIPTLTQTAGTPIVTFSWGGWTVGNTVATWTHVTNWAAGVLQTVQVSGGADLAGNAGPTASWSFTTASNPYATVTVLAPVTPSNDNTPAITYVYGNGPTSVNIYRATVATGPYTLIGADATIDGAYTVPAAIPDGTYYFAAVANGETTPPVASEFGPYVIDTAAPTQTHVPATGATGVLIGASVVVTYNEAMNPATIPTLTQTGGSPIVTFTWGGWSVGNTVATWTHATSWAYLTVQTVQVSGGADLAGNAGPTASWSFTTENGGGTTTTWNLYNGRNYRTFTSTLTASWMASELAIDIIAYINTQYGESLTDVDVTVTMYDSFAGSFLTCYYFDIIGMWMDDFSLAEGDGYIVEILNDAMTTSPRSYELPNTEISTAVSVSLYNGRNYRGFPVITSAATMASELAIDIIAYINTQYGESLTDVDVTVTMYDSFAGSFLTCYYFDIIGMWMDDFSLASTDGYIVEILNDALATSPRTYAP